MTQKEPVDAEKLWKLKKENFLSLCHVPIIQAEKEVSKFMPYVLIATKHCNNFEIVKIDKLKL